MHSPTQKKVDKELLWRARVERCGTLCRLAKEQDWNRDTNMSFLLAVSCKMVINARCGGKWRAVWWMVRQILMGYQADFMAWRWRHLSNEEFSKKLERG